MCYFQAKARSSDKEKAMPASEPRWQFSKNPGVQSSKSGDHADAVGGLDGPRCQEPRCQVPRCQEPRCQVPRCPGVRCPGARRPCRQGWESQSQDVTSYCSTIDNWKNALLLFDLLINSLGEALDYLGQSIVWIVLWISCFKTFDFFDFFFGSYHITDNHHNSKLVKTPWSQWQIMMRMCTWANLGNSNGLISSRYLFSLSPTLKMHSLKMSQERKGSHL